MVKPEVPKLLAWEQKHKTKQNRDLFVPFATFQMSAVSPKTDLPSKLLRGKNDPQKKQRLERKKIAFLYFPLSFLTSRALRFIWRPVGRA